MSEKIYPSNAPLRAVKAQDPNGEVVTTYQYDNDAVIISPLQRFMRKLRERTFLQLATLQRRLASERRTLSKAYLATTLVSRKEVIQKAIDVVELQQNAVNGEIYVRPRMKGVRQGCI